jgi:DNA-binding response OmpR family regulator
MNWVPAFAGTTYNKTLTTIRRFENLFQTDSGYTDSRIKFAADGPNYIQKPFTVEGLARKVRDVLKKTADGSKLLQTFDIQYQS